MHRWGDATRLSGPPSSLLIALVIVALTACSGSNKAHDCKLDSECNLGEVCSHDACSPGCRTNRDCPLDRALCDSSAGPDGACVQCLGDADCSAGQTCLTGKCRKTCESDVDCPGQKCDLDAKACVDCLESSDCALGNLCIAQTCTAGCERDRDCPADTPACDPHAGDHGTCFQCVTTAQCQGSQQCADDHHCHDACASNADCATGVCDIPAGICVQCLDKAQCPLGNLCEAKECVNGCEEDRDCPTSLPVCDPTAGTYGTCYQCTVNADCGTQATCVDHVCQGDAAPMVDIAAGSFVMGSDTDTATDNLRHTVTLSAYSIDTLEVTNARYKKCVDAAMCPAPTVTTEFADPTKAQHPVTYVTWQDAETFCAWAGKRLPTEAEWERAARGTDERTYPWGSATPSCTLTNGAVGGTGSDPCANALTDAGVHPTGASAAGVQDMAGNAREWVSDWYAAYPAGAAADPQGPNTGTDKIARGGSWTSTATDLSTYTRPTRAPTSADQYIGFRCARGGAAPIPVFTVTPGSGPVSTAFAVDASASTDPTYATSQLQVRWDWQNDGTFDTAFTTTKTALHTYASPGNYTILLEVKNPAGIARRTTRQVLVTGSGGQGSPCTATSQCQGGYVCLSAGTCAQTCDFANPVCSTAGTTCSPALDVSSNFVFACQ